jgi:hypothetical protein
MVARVGPVVKKNRLLSQNSNDGTRRHVSIGGTPHLSPREVVSGFGSPVDSTGVQTPDRGAKGALRERWGTRLTSDGFRPYVNAVEDAFGTEVDYAMLVKIYSESGQPDTRYSPGEIVDARPITIMGNPKPRLISTSHIERQNLTIRMQLHRFTRLTNAFSKKLENMKAALSLYFAWYNFCRVHLSLRVTLALAAGITETVWPLETLLRED